MLHSKIHPPPPQNHDVETLMENQIDIKKNSANTTLNKHAVKGSPKQQRNPPTPRPH